ncbi:tetratricopeptide repeat protein [Endozoicomonas montiporae]|uniref:Tight adherence protein D n=1 Tax=Endozoicomonas montiporae CL-33 TaxID=570277 RepID=A0A142BB05_9GAMM|nr:hypothetical protein [Endozoicomonas montiporae]AMO55931.1 tight adherence protein D [Endozoicomonas montiporae CL-33]
MFKTYSWIVVLLVPLMIQGCTTTGQVVTDIDAPNEALLQAAGNHAGLIELYKTRLMNAGNVQEQDQCRYQLGQAYLAMSDPESTLFYIKPVTDEGRGNDQLWLLKSRAYLALDQPDKSLYCAETALAIKNNNPYVHNQLGQVYARVGDYAGSRAAFTEARVLMLDDVIVKNNLAMLDILESDYDSAVRRLMPVYNAGQADDTVKANLVLALVRSGRYDEFVSVMQSAETEEERVVLFSILAALEPVIRNRE